MELSKIIGHSHQRDALKKLLTINKMPGAILLSGKSGIGKKLVAMEFAKTLFCEDYASAVENSKPIPYGGCGKCKTCRNFDVGSLPDLHLIDCLDKDSWSAEQTRELLYSLNLKSFSGGSRVIILDNAEHLGTQAANILLKTLEEPRPGTYFILICSNPYRLPPTLLSRCQVWYFDSLQKNAIEEILSQETAKGSQSAADLLNKFNIDELAKVSDGSMENLLTFGDYYEDWQEINSLLNSVLKGELAKCHDLSSFISKNKDSQRVLLNLTRVAVHTKLRELSNSHFAAALSICLTNLVLAENLIFERNLTAQNILLNIFIELCPAKTNESSLYSSSNIFSLINEITL